MNKTRVAAGLLVLTLALTGCEADKKPAKKAESPVAGRVQAKDHRDKAYTLLLKKDGRSRTVYVTESAWIKCQLDRWYPTCKR